MLENESESHVAMKETTAYLMTDMLKNAVSAGTGGQARFNGMHIAGKTGTTNDNKDRYFVGFTPYYVAAVPHTPRRAAYRCPDRPGCWSAPWRAYYQSPC